MAVEVLQSTGALQMQVTGTSMLPTLWPGDLVRIQSHQSDFIGQGDVVLFEREGRFFLHRVVQATVAGEHSLITRGDCMVQEDLPISPSDVLGRIVEVRRGNKTIAFAQAISQPQRLFAWFLSRWDILHRVVLRLHSMRNRGGSQDAVTATGLSV